MEPDLTHREPKQPAAAKPAAGGSAELRQAMVRASAFAAAEKAHATRKAYNADYQGFRTWCEVRGTVSLPATPLVVAAYLSDEADRGIKASTLARRVAAIRDAHRLAGLATPTEADPVRMVIRGIRRTIGTRKTPKAPATSDRLIAMVAVPDRTLVALRDRAMLLLGFAAALRRSELVRLDVADVVVTAEGLRIIIRSSKTDQDAKGSTVTVIRGAIACPVEAVMSWIAVAGIRQGPLFRQINKAGKLMPRRLTGQTVALIVKAHAKRAGLDPRAFSGHSLRSGLITSAARRGASILKIAAISRHRNVECLRAYVDDAELFYDHAGDGLL
jgi:site-specific recombinase XerD